MTYTDKQYSKNRRVVKFHRAYRDLEPMDEHWERDTFENREKKIADLFLEKTRYPPTKHLSYLRITSFPILDETTMDQLKCLCGILQCDYGIECIQISVDREKNFAHLMFDFVDKELVRTCDINVSDYKYMLATIYHTLDFYQYDLPDDLVRYYLVSAMEKDPKVFQLAMAKISQAQLGRRSYRIIRNSLQYMEQICRDIAVKRKRHQKVSQIR